MQRVPLFLSFLALSALSSFASLALADESSPAPVAAPTVEGAPSAPPVERWGGWSGSSVDRATSPAETGGALGSLVRLLVPGGPLYTNALVGALAANPARGPADLRPTFAPCVSGFRGGATVGVGVRF